MSSLRNAKKCAPLLMTMTLTALLAINVNVCIGYKILMLPLLSKSHISNLLTVARVLDARGHQVQFVLSTDYARDYKTTVKDTQIKLIDYLWGVPIENIEEATEDFVFDFFKGQKTYSDFVNGLNSFNPLRCTVMTRLPSVSINRLREENFDLVFLDSNPASMCYYLIPLLLDVKWISYMDYPNPALIRLPWLPSFVPEQRTSYSDRMDFHERILNVKVALYMYLRAPVMESIADLEALKEFKREHNKSFENLNELVSRSSLFFLTSDNILGYPRPMMPNVVEIGGLTTSEPKELPADMEEFMDSANEGVVVVTFGSMLSRYPQSLVEKFLSAFSRLERYNVVWRLRNTDNAKLSSNVRAWNWLPQNDALGHHKTKLFITHCGNSGQFEALYNKVPMLGFPSLGDQVYNCARMKVKGYGLVLSLFDFTSDELLTNMLNILTNQTYYERVSKASEIFRSAPERPVQRAVRWVEHICQFGADHLRSAGNDHLTLPQYLMIDILVLISLAVIVIVGVVYCVVSAVAMRVIVLVSRKRQKTD